MKHIDIVVPVKNEAKNIRPLVKRVHKAMSRSKVGYELIFIDDHSDDETVENLKALQKTYPIKIYLKKGQPGKAYSIIEGAKYSKSEYVVMIDGDLQYPPEAIPQMLKMAEENGVVIASRKHNHDSKARALIHLCYNTFFNRFLHGFNFDVQSGLKLFKKEILSLLNPSTITPWTLDLTLLTTARQFGYSIAEVEINFERRKAGQSKVSLTKTSIEIGLNALKLKFAKGKIFQILPQTKGTMVGAGVVFKGKRLITHTTLDSKQSALETFTTKQVLFIISVIICLIVGVLLNALLTATVVVAILSAIYFIDVLFNLYVILKSLHHPPELRFPLSSIRKIDNSLLPVYSILCPLYKEAHILPQFIKSIQSLNWPKDKLDVLLLLEADDSSTIDAAKNMSLPKYFTVLIVPPSLPKTKPKACNFGLNFARGEYLVIFDAEDIPDPNQLKIAFLGFQKMGSKTVCLQAKLNYFNPHQNLLTRFFTAEYSLWFDVILTGLQSTNTALPLGGTSNHFKTEVLRQIKGWDAFNVTEDCDLGVRLFKQGYKTAMINSTTLEEANSNTKNWLRQRSRWIKGYIQTYWVHMRNPIQFIRSHGIHAFIFQLIIGARISFMLINPLLWTMTLVYFTLYTQVGPTIESLYPSVVFYLAVVSLVFGNFMYIYNYMIGCAKRKQWSLIKYIYFVPIYWFLASLAACIAFYQLLTKPHYWEKTNHGLVIQPTKEVRWPIFEPVFAPIRQTLSIFF